MKRILIIGQTDNPGGVETVIKRYYEFLQQDFRMDFMVFTNTCYDEAYFKAHQSRIVFIKSAQFRHPLAYKKEIHTFFEVNKGIYDVIWFNCCDLANSGYIMKQAKITGIRKRIIHAHNTQLMQTGKRRYFYSLMHHYWKNHISRYATDFWACSESAGEFFYKAPILKGKAFKIIHNAIETEKYAYDSVTRKQIRGTYNLENRYVIGHVGRFQFQKNHEFLIDIFYEYLKLDSRAVLMLVGQGEEEDAIRQKVINLGIEKSVLFMGVRTDVNRLLQAMDVFLLPSRFEGLPLVLIEAQTSGLRCLTTKNKVPYEVNVTGNVEFEELKENSIEWAHHIEYMEKQPYDRKSCLDLITDAGYDILKEAEKMESYMCEE